MTEEGDAYDEPMGDAELLARAEERVGSTLGKYGIERVLGVGGTAAVFEARHRNGHRVAVKLLHREFSLDKELRRRFLREGYAANKVEHPGVLRVIDDDATGEGDVFLVMELLEGESLDHRIEKEGALPPQEVVGIVVQVLDVLASAHGKGIVHRDIKPSNLFVTKDGTVKVLDFGVARLLDGSKQVTMSGAVVGTPAYMPPEQVLGRTRDVDAQSDLYAVGATAFVLLSGKHPHDAETSQEMMVAVATKPARLLEAVAPNLSGPLAEAIDRALRFEKSERWPDARAMRDAVLAAEAGKEPPKAARSAESPTPSSIDGMAAVANATQAPTRRRSKRSVVLMAFAGCAVLGAALLVSLSTGETRRAASPAPPRIASSIEPSANTTAASAAPLVEPSAPPPTPAPSALESRVAKPPSAVRPRPARAPAASATPSATRDPLAP